MIFFWKVLENLEVEESRSLGMSCWRHLSQDSFLLLSPCPPWGGSPLLQTTPFTTKIYGLKSLVLWTKLDLPFCISDFSTAVIKYPDIKQLRKASLFELTVPEGYDPSGWAKKAAGVWGQAFSKRPKWSHFICAQEVERGQEMAIKPLSLTDILAPAIFYLLKVL